MKKKKSVRSLVVMMLLVLIVISYYAYLSNRSSKGRRDDTVITAVQQVLLKDLEKDYPPSPKEVIKYYSSLTQCFYNEELSEEDMRALGLKARELYDDDLKANQEEEKYLSDLKFDIASFRNKKIKVSSFSTSSSTDVDYFTEDGREWARLYCIYNLRQETKMLATREVFLLRRDTDGHWKIYGWDLAEPEEEISNG